MRYQAAPQPADQAPRRGHEGELYYGRTLGRNPSTYGRLGRVARWTCPNCEREFGRARQAHVCAPGITVEELLCFHDASVTEIYTAVIDALRAAGPTHEDAVDVGIFLKSDRSIAQFRPQVRSVQLWFFLPYRLEDERVSRIEATGVDRYVHLVKLTSPAEVDEKLRAWLTESYDANTD